MNIKIKYPLAMVSFLNCTSYKNVYSSLPGGKFVSKQQKWKTSTKLGPVVFQKKAQKNQIEFEKDW